MWSIEARMGSPSGTGRRAKREPPQRRDPALLAHLPDQRFQLWDSGGQKDAERDGVGGAGDGAGDDGSSHGEGQHGVDNKHDKQEERHLEADAQTNRETDQASFWGDRNAALKLPVSCPSKGPGLILLCVVTNMHVCVCVSQALLIDKWNPDLPASISTSSAVPSNPSCYGGDQHGSAETGTTSDLPARLFASPIF